MKINISVMDAAKGLFILFSANALVYLAIILGLIKTPLTNPKILNFTMDSQMLSWSHFIASIIIVLMIFVRVEWVKIKLNYTLLTFIFGLISICSFLGTIYLINDMRFLPICFTLLVTLLSWKLALYPSEESFD
jgi:hypothetical protein